MKSSYIVRARHFAEMIYPFIVNCKTPNEYEQAVENFNILYKRNVRVAHGQTRIVLITSDYVLKVDYGAMGKMWGDSACELKAYNKAFNDGFAYLFARINSVMVNEKVYYIMPRIKDIGFEHNGYDDAYEVVTDEESDYLFENFRDLHYENYGWKDSHPVIVDYACASE